MERVGSRPGAVEILAQLDIGPDPGTSDWSHTRRYYVTRAPEPSRLLATLGATNTGDPAILEAFIRVGAQRYPAQATALILSNHGSGVWVPPEMHQQSRARSPRRRRRFFRPGRVPLAADAQARGIAYDDSAGDCLDNLELKRVLAQAHSVLQRPVDLVGMDACLMTMLEVAYQLRDHASILVGSEDLEPEDGWPHDLILADLTRRPTMSPAELGTVIVQRYIESYTGTGEAVTQSAIDLTQLDDLVEAVDQLAKTLVAALPNARLSAAIRSAWRRSLRFFDDDYVDLHHWVTRLARSANRRAIRQACLAVQERIVGEGSPIIAEAHRGAPVAAARGLSVYFPARRDPTAYYRALDFAQRVRWADFLDLFLGAPR